MKWFYRNSGCGGADANSDEPQLIRISKVVKISESEDELGGSEVTAGAAISAPSSAVAPLTYYVNRDAFIKRKSSDIISGSGL